MNYYIDTEFYEDGERIHLISIGIVSDGGKELYFENAEFDWSIVPADHWIQENVRPLLKGGTCRATREYIRVAILELCQANPVFHAYYADYDWVVFCQLFGTMMQLPATFPMYCRDLKQTMAMFGLGKDWTSTAVPPKGDEHNALADAKWNRLLHIELQRFALYSKFKSKYLEI